MAILKLQFFGNFAVYVHGNPISQFRSDKIRALLIYLAVESDRTHQREFLASLLWPDMPYADGLRNLRKSLSRLRKSLGQDVSEQLLFSTRQTLGLNRAEIDLDVLTFGQTLRQVATHTHTSIANCPECCQQLEMAVQKYTGEFLNGFMLTNNLDFSDWIVMHRERWHQRYLATLHTLTTVYIEQQKWQHSLVHAQQQVSVEPWREAAYCQLMQIYSGMGQLGEVTRQYEMCRQQLWQELGVAPSAQTKDLYEQLIQTAVSLAPRSPVPKARVNLPRQFTSFVGREQELTEIIGRLENPACALLTLFGPGGVGKTRVAVEVARQKAEQYRDGVIFVSLAAINDTADIVRTILDAVDLPRINKQSSQRQLLDFLKEKNLLLILDNFEHLLPGANVVVEILRGAPGVQVLITSRVALNLQAEWLYELGGLRLPIDKDEKNAVSYSAVQLFMTRLFQIGIERKPSPTEMAEIIRICQLVAGMPLAIELAASQSRLSSLPIVAADLARSMDAIQTEMIDVAARHRSMRTVFDYSWRSLSKQEKSVLMRLSVFAGGFSIEAAAEVAAASTAVLNSLRDKSFLHKTAVNRYDLHEVLRQYTRAKFVEAGLETAALRKHSQYYLDNLSRQGQRMVGPDGKAIMTAMQSDLANISQAWHNACTLGAVVDLQQSQFALSQMLYLRGLLRQGERMFAEGIAAVTPLLPSDLNQSHTHLLLAQLLNGHARFLLHQGQVNASEARAREALTVAQAGNFSQEEALAQLQLAVVYTDRSDYEAADVMYDEVEKILTDLVSQTGVNLWQIRHLQALNYKQRCDAFWEKGEFTQAKFYLEKAQNLDKENEDIRGEASCFHRQGVIARIQGAPDQAIYAFERSIALAQGAGYSRLQHLLKCSLALTYSDKGDNVTAQKFFREFYQSSREMGDTTSQLTGLINLGLVSARQGTFMEAKAYYEQALILAIQLQNKRNEGIILGNLGVVAMRMGDFAEAARLFADSLAVRLVINDRPGEMYSRYYLARLALYEGNYETALTESQKVLEMAKQTPVSNVDNLARTSLGHAYTKLERFDLAHSYYQEALEQWQKTGQKHLVIGPLSGLARIALLNGHLDRAIELCNIILEEAPALDLESTFEPFDIWLICLEILFATGDDRADSLLREVSDRLQARALSIPDPDRKSRFLQKIPAHYEIVRLMRETIG